MVNRQYPNKEYTGRKIVSFLLKHYRALYCSEADYKTSYNNKIAYEFLLHYKCNQLSVRIIAENVEFDYTNSENRHNCIRNYEISINPDDKHSFFDKTRLLFSNKDIIDKIKCPTYGVKNWELTLIDESGEQYDYSGIFVDQTRSRCQELMDLSKDLRTLANNDTTLPAFDNGCIDRIPQTVFEIKERFSQILNATYICDDEFKRKYDIDDMLNELTVRYIFMIQQFAGNNLDAAVLTDYGQTNYFCGKTLNDHSSIFIKSYKSDQPFEFENAFPKRMIQAANNFSERKLMNMYTPGYLRTDYIEIQPVESRLYSDADFLLILTLFNVPNVVDSFINRTKIPPNFFTITQNHSNRYTFPMK